MTKTLLLLALLFAGCGVEQREKPFIIVGKYPYTIDREIWSYTYRDYFGNEYGFHDKYSTYAVGDTIK